MRAEVERYLAQRKAEGLAGTTLGAYRRSIERFTAYLAGQGLKRWADVSPEHVDAYLAWNDATVRAWSSRENLRIEMRAYCRWLAGQGAVLIDPARHVELARPSKDDLPLLEPPLSEEQVAAVLDGFKRRSVLDLRDVLIVELLYSAGLRRGEALALDIRDVDLHNGAIHVRRGKGSKPRDVPMMCGLAMAARDYLALRRSLLKGPDTGALLLTRRGTRMGPEVMAAMLTKLSKRHRLHLHPHRFRHAIAVHMLRGGADIRYVQAFLGHDDIESTKVYLRLVPEDLREAYDKAMPEIAVGT